MSRAQASGVYDSLDAKQKNAFDTGGHIGGIFDWWGKR
jgi:hypothetical protein